MIENPEAFANSFWNWDFLKEWGCFIEAGPKFAVADLDGIAVDDQGPLLREGIVHRANQLYGVEAVTLPGNVLTTIRRYSWNGHWLLFETKGDRVRLKPGAEWNYGDLVRVGFSIIYLWGEPNQPTAMQLWREGESDKKPKVEPASLDDICRLARRWFLWASKNPSVVDDLRETIRVHERKIIELQRKIERLEGLD